MARYISFLIIFLLIFITFTPITEGVNLLGYPLQFFVWCIGPIVLFLTILFFALFESNVTNDER